MDTQARSYSALSWFDYFLTGSASCLAGFSAGYGLGAPGVALFFVAWIFVATLLGSVLQRYMPRKLVAADGIFYAVCAIFAMFYTSDLNSLLPGDGFPDQLRIAGWLCWMLVFGSFFMWRDSTVLFQAVPGIAIFGLVGTWDTFRASPFLFFVFLLCFATLFARAHSRGMMVRARNSGFTSNALDADKPGGFLAALRRGPWKWMAGPEWALLSALVVVLVSLIGGPFLQFSLKGVSGKISLPPPPTNAMRQNYFGSSNQVSTNFTSNQRVSVGNGPRGELQKVKIFELSFGSRGAYMLAHTCREYNGRGWDPIQTLRDPLTTSEQFFKLCTQPSSTTEEREFAISYLSGTYDSVPVPDQIQNIDGISPDNFRMDGTVANSPESTFGHSGTALNGIFRVSTARPEMADTTSLQLQPYTDVDGSISTQRVRDLANGAVQGAKTDYAKAEAIRSFIANRCTYDLNAPAVPQGQDAVDYFLFSSKRGYCDLFASAMTVMAQSVGLPTRFVTGWAPFTAPNPDSTGWLTYYDTDYHCWSETYFKDVGWVILDATDGAQEVPGAGRGDMRSSTPWYLQWSVGFGLVALTLIGLAALALSLGAKFKFRIPMLAPKKSDLERAYADLTRMTENRTGKPKRPSQTPFEYLEAITPYLDGSYEAVKAATDSFVAAYYGSEEPLPENVLIFKEHARLAKEALKRVKRPKE